MTVQADVRIVTVAEAQQLLANQMPQQREIKEGRVHQYADEMAKGNWQDGASILGINQAGELVNGGHRLTAQVQTGLDIVHVVVTGIPQKAAAYIDQGAPRDLKDALVILGICEKQEAKKVAALAQMLVHGRTPAPPVGTTGPTLTEKVRYTESHLALIREAIEMTQRFENRAYQVGLKNAPLSFCVYQAVQAGLFERFWQFMLDAIEGADDKGTPAHALRSAYHRATRSREPMGTTYMAAITLKGFVKHLRGEKTRQAVQWKRSESFPVLSEWTRGPDDEDENGGD